MYDVIVVGAGPAGATAARYAAMAGLKTLIIEKEKHPRIKVCGGGLTIRAFSNLGIDIPGSLIERRCSGVRIRYRDTYLESEADEDLILMISRENFDHYLARCAVDAGAELMEEVSVRSVDVLDDHALVKTTQGSFKSNVVIGADGVRSVCARNVRPGFRPEHLGFLLEAEIAYSNEFIDDYLRDKCEFHFGVVENGYGWVFPKDGHLSVGIGCMGSSYRDPMKVYNDYIERLGFEYVKPRGHFLPVGGVKRRTYSDRILLAGDAAGYVDTFLGEGIFYAVRSGSLAAETVVAAHESSDFSGEFLSSYQKKCEDDFWSNLKYSLIFSRLFHHYPDMSVSKLATNESVLNKFIYFPTGKLDYLSFMKWLAPRLPYYMIK